MGQPPSSWPQHGKSSQAIALVDGAIRLDFTILGWEASGSLHHHDGAHMLGSLWGLAVSVGLKRNPRRETESLFGKGCLCLGLFWSGLVHSYPFNCTLTITKQRSFSSCFLPLLFQLKCKTRILSLCALLFVLLFVVLLLLDVLLLFEQTKNEVYYYY